MRSRPGIVAWLSATLFVLNAASAQERDSLSPVTMGGFVDAYFSWNMARPTSRVNQLRNFDIAENEFVLSEAQVDIQRAAEPIGFHIAVNTGAASDIIHAGSTSSMNLLMQGFLTLVLPLGHGLALDAGKFVTHMGFETINAKDNFNYSRSFLFAWAIPYYHVGVRATYPLLEQLTAGVSVSNGWNAASMQKGKTFGALITFTPLPAMTLTANWIGGPGQADSLSSPFRQVGEVIVAIHPSDRLTFAADAVYGTEKTPGSLAIWRGGALYGRYAFTDDAAVAVRGEIFDDPHGFTTGQVQTLTEFTFTFEQRILSNLLLRAEYRHDRSSIDVFDGSGGPGIQSRQNTFAVCGIVVF